MNGEYSIALQAAIVLGSLHEHSGHSCEFMDHMNEEFARRGFTCRINYYCNSQTYEVVHT